MILLDFFNIQVFLKSRFICIVFVDVEASASIYMSVLG